MKTQEEKNALKQLIYKAEMYQTIDLLGQQLILYRQKKKINLYQFQQEFDAIHIQLADLRLRIEHLMEAD